MRRLALVLLLATGCSAGSLTPEQQRQRCEAFADKVAEAGLRGTPDGELASRIADDLDAQLSRLGSPKVHSPAVRIHGDLHIIAAAVKQGDQASADKAAAKARGNIEEMASACGLPSSRWLGSAP